jgi:hypothetical protein
VYLELKDRLEVRHHCQADADTLCPKEYLAGSYNVAAIPQNQRPHKVRYIISSTAPVHACIHRTPCRLSAVLAGVVRSIFIKAAFSRSHISYARRHPSSPHTMAACHVFVVASSLAASSRIPFPRIVLLTCQGGNQQDARSGKGIDLLHVEKDSMFTIYNGLSFI